MSAAEKAAAKWNERYPVGTPVTYWPGFQTGEGRTSRTRTPAWVICESAVVSVDGYAGGIALTHVTPIQGGAR